MNIREAIEALHATANHLATDVAAAQKPVVSESLKQLEDAATRASKAWSGSSLGYHSRVYYKDFRPPPGGAHFSSEWGFMSVFSNPTSGDWVEYAFDDAIEVIEQMADHPDMSEADRLAEQARATFDEAQAEVVSVLTAVTKEKTDEFLTSMLEEARGLRPLSFHQAVRSFLPVGSVMSRDTTAITQGLQGAPHQHVLARAMSVRSTMSVCSELKKAAERAATHLERLSGRDPVIEAGRRVFIGHGGSPLWRELKDFVQDRLGLTWDEFNRVPVAGVTNVARLAEMLNEAGIAFLVLTAEDEDKDGRVHARLNVVHEAGLFQGRLGFSRAIVLLEEGCEEFSNIEGLGQIRFPAGNIAACFEEVRRVLEREGFGEDS